MAWNVTVAVCINFHMDLSESAAVCVFVISAIWRSPIAPIGVMHSKK